jgi:hypothetical protein
VPSLDIGFLAKRGIGAVLVISGVLQLFGFPGDVLSWGTIIGDHWERILSGLLIALGIAIVFDLQRFAPSVSIGGGVARQDLTEILEYERKGHESVLGEVKAELEGCQRHVEELKRIRDEAWADAQSKDRELQELAPTVRWAKSLIHQEVTFPKFEHPRVRSCHISHATHLTDPQPYMKVVIELPYHGNMRLLVGHEFKGKFGFADTKFADAPEVEERPYYNQTFPFEGAGRATVWIVLHQKLLGRQDEIKQYLDTHDTITLDTKGMVLSIRIEDPINGALMHTDNLFGAELTAQVPHGG